MESSYRIIDNYIMYFDKVFMEPKKFIDDIYNFTSPFIGDWEDWGNKSDFKYGKTKFLDRASFILEAESNKNIDKDTMYFLNRIYYCLSYCTRKYMTYYGFSVNDIDFSLKSLELSRFGLNKYYEKTYMGPHIDRDENNKNAYFVIIIYLTDDYEGGEISFIGQNITIKPKAGDVIIFPGDKRFTHKVKEIVKGEKILINHHINLDSEKG